MPLTHRHTVLHAVVKDLLFSDLLYYKALRILTYTPVFEEVVGLSPTGSLLLYSILPGEGLPLKKVANALVGHQLQGPKRFLH